MRTIAILCPDFSPPWLNGRAVHVRALIDGLTRRGYKFVVFALGEKPSSFNYNDHTIVHCVPDSSGASVSEDPNSGGSSNVRPNEDLASYVLDLVERDNLRIDLLHCHESFLIQAALLLRERLSIPIVSTVHYLSEPFERRLGYEPMREVIRDEGTMCVQSDSVIAVSQCIKQTIVQLYPVETTRVRVIYNGLDSASFPQTQADSLQLALIRRRLGLVSEKIVMFAGRFSPEKGISGLLRSAMHITSKHSDVLYLIAGHRPRHEYADQYQSLIANHPRLRTRVRLLGHQSREELRLLYRIAHVAIIPSIFEPLGYAALEAMLSGVATIASDTDGLAEIIEHERSGLLIPLKDLGRGLYDVDVPKLVEAQERLLNDTALAARLGAAGKRRVLDHFPYEAMLQHTMEIYEGTISSGLLKM